MDLAHTKTASIEYDSSANIYFCRGEWDLSHLSELRTHFQKLKSPLNTNVQVNAKALTKLDSAGAWLLTRWQKELEAEEFKITYQDLNPQYQTLLQLINEKIEAELPIPQAETISGFGAIGKLATDLIKEAQEYFAFIGLLTINFLRLFTKESRSRMPAYALVVYRNGFQALPIIALLSLMIGVVITYQMGLQLKSYGANIFIVDLLGLSMLREFGPLLTAIMVAGRTGSAFTAQLGSMKLNQEIDALSTMGVTPSEVLLIPRVIGLLVALPLLTIWANVFGVLGGMLMANSMLGITWYDFLHRFPTVIPLKTLLIGLGKTPIFALLISTIGCFQGMRVEGGADSIGRNTTRSVVLAIFFIIVADALFSVIFSKLKL